MHLPAHCLGTKQAWVALGACQIQLTQRQAGKADDLVFDAGTDEFHVVLVHRGGKYGKEAFVVTHRATLRLLAKGPVHPLKMYHPK